MAEIAARQLDELLVAATVRVDVPGSSTGAGFQVAPGWVVTCAHVVGDAGVRVRVTGTDGVAVTGVVRDAWPAVAASASGALHNAPDLALVELDAALAAVPCVRLDARWPNVGERLELCGMAESFGGVSAETAVLEYGGQKATPVEGVRLMKVGGAAIVAGMSGGPVVSHATGGVIGTVRTSHHTVLPAGGWAVPAELIRRRWPKVAAAHDAHHASDDRWRRVAEDWAGLAAELFVPHVGWHAGLPPSTMLRPEYELVGFAGRSAEVTALADWCAGAARFGLRLVTGPAGQGKTRLAAHVCAQMTPQWVAGVLRTRQTAGRSVLAGDGADAELDAGLADRVAGCTAPLLLAVDYAETQPALIRQLAGLLRLRAAAGVPGRLLLLARSAGDWLAELRRDVDEELASWLDVDSTLPLSELTTGTTDRAEEFDRAVAAFAAYRGEDPAVVATPADLATDRYARVLEIHSASLAALLDRAASAPVAGGKGPVARVLAHEERFWAASAAALRLPEPHPERLDQVVAAGTLVGPLPHAASAAGVLASLPTFHGQSPDVVDRYARWASSLDPSEGWLYRLRPDRLGEDHATATVLRRPELGSGLLDLASSGEDLAEWQIDQALTVLGRATPRYAELAQHLSNLITGNPALVQSAVRVAPTLADPFPLVSAIESALVAHPPSTLEDARLLDQQLPEHSLSLAAVAAAISAAIVDHLRDATATADAGHSDAFLPDLATSLNNLSVRLGGLGRWEEGLAAIEEAVTVYRRLARDRPDVFLPGLALSLNNLSVHLGELGGREEGLAAIEEAVAIRRRLAKDRPDAFLPNLAMSLNNLSLRLGGLGRWEEGLAAIEEAVTVYRRLAKDRPDAFLPDLALSLNNLSLRLGELGRQEEGLAAIEEAVTVYRRLAKDRPDAFLPDLATSLNNLSLRLGELGRQEEGLAAIEEAVTVYRRLAKARPDALLPDLAMSLNNLSLRLGELGRREEGLAAIEEAVAIRRRLAKARPDAFLPDLAMSLNNLSVDLGELGRREEGLAAIEEAVTRLGPFSACRGWRRVRLEARWGGGRRL